MNTENNLNTESLENNKPNTDEKDLHSDILKNLNNKRIDKFHRELCVEYYMLKPLIEGGRPLDRQGITRLLDNNSEINFANTFVNTALTPHRAMELVKKVDNLSPYDKAYMISSEYPLCIDSLFMGRRYTPYTRGIYYSSNVKRTLFDLPNWQDGNNLLLALYKKFIHDIMNSKEFGHGSIWNMRLQESTINYLINRGIFPDKNLKKEIILSLPERTQYVLIDLFEIGDLDVFLESKNHSIRIAAYKRIGITKSLDRMLIDPHREVRSLAISRLPLGYQVPPKVFSSERSRYNLGRIIQLIDKSQMPFILGNKKLQSNKYLMSILQEKMNEESY